MKKLAQFISVCALFLPLHVAVAHTGHGTTQNGPTLFHYLADHQGFILTLMAITLIVLAKNRVLERS